MDSDFAVSLISNGVKLKFKNPLTVGRLLKVKINQRYMSPSNKILLKPEIDKLVEQGILHCCKVSTSYKTRYFENYIFPRIKPNGDVRIIFDMKLLNKELVFKTFKNMKLSDLYPYLHSCSYACRLDLTSAYYHLGVSESCKNFLSFKFDNHIYTWNAMPFGLSEAPYLFSKMMECVVTNLRVKYKLIILFYLDDILILDCSFEACRNAIITAIDFISSLGITINCEKSVITPVQIITFLGVKLDLVNKTMSPSPDNVNKCILKTQNFLKRPRANRTCFKSLIGSLNFSANFTWSGRNDLKNLAKFHSLFRNHQWVPIPRLVKKLLEIWTVKDFYADIPVPKAIPDVILFTDASLKGWGGVFIIGESSFPVNGSWDHTEKSLTMNSLETLAILKAFQVCPQVVMNVAVHVLSDNTTAVSSVRRLGSTKFLARQQIISQLITLLKEKNISISIAHLKGSLNVCADALSRSVTSLLSEAILSQEKFATLCLKLGIKPQVDLFGNHWNNKCPLFTPFSQSSRFQTADSLLTNWSTLETAYAFPPPRLIPKTIFKWLREGNGILLLVTPKWKKIIWFAQLLQIAKTWFQLDVKELDLYVNSPCGRTPCHVKPSCLIGWLL